MRIAKGLWVEIDYELSVRAGRVLESSSKTGPLHYIHGQGKMLPGLERRMEGLSPGDEKRGDIPPEEAFGTEASFPLKEMIRGEFPPGAILEPGTTFEAKGPTGDPVVIRIVSRDGDRIHARLIHPLAGKTLQYRVKVLAVESAHSPPPPPGAVELDLDEIQDP